MTSGEIQAYLSKATLTGTFILGAALSQNLITGKAAAWCAIILAAVQSLQPRVNQSGKDVDTANAAVNAAK